MSTPLRGDDPPSTTSLRADTLDAPAHTLTRPVILDGVGLHSGAPCRLIIHPTTSPGWRLGPPDAATPIERARVASSAWASVLISPDGRRHATVEHILAALSGMGVDGACLELRGGDEMPGLDGSAALACEAIAAAGLRPLPCARPIWRLSAPLTLRGDGDEGWRWVDLRPCARRVLRCTLRFDDLAPTACQAHWDEARQPFASALASARTFALARWVQALRASGRARGADLTCAVVFDDDGHPLNPEGLRAANEPARHKLLDLLGDLALLGRPLLADVRALGPGHALNARVVAALRGARGADPPPPRPRSE